MTLPLDTVKELKKSETLSLMQQDLNQKETHSKTMIVFEDFKVENLERFNEFKDRFKGEFVTKNKRSFVEYAKVHTKESGSACFVDSERMTAKAIFDLGSDELPEHCVNKASLSLKNSSSYHSLTRAAGYEIDQKTLINFIEDWKDNIDNFFDGYGNVFGINVSITALKNMTIERHASINSKVGDFNAETSSMEKAQAKAEGILPCGFVFKTSPFISLSQRDLTVRVSVLTGSPKIAFSLRILQHEAIKEEMAEEFQEILSDDLKETLIPVYVGEF